MAHLAKVVPILMEGQQFFGMLPAEVKRRLTAVIVNPCNETWAAAHCIIIKPSEKLTLWDIVCMVDPTFPDYGPKYDHTGQQLTDWPRIPEPDLLATAVLFALDARTT